MCSSTEVLGLPLYPAPMHTHLHAQGWGHIAHVTGEGQSPTVLALGN